ncbi:tetratricopeptide repeat protein [uncultured Fibrella sp.]|uniref:tetratricopeptide repeat protein n=1 Tax=uncultured Fibrella sp. TaxID=1284596 RepID=UPI0035CC9C4F
MNQPKNALLATLFIGAATLVPATAQDIASGLKDLEAERVPKAEQTFKQLASTAPTAENQFYLGYFLLKTGKPDEAKAAFEKGLAADPKNQLNNVGLAGVALTKKDLATAKAKTDEAVAATKGKNSDVLFRAGEMYTLFEGDKGANDPARAIELLERAKVLDKKNQNVEIPMAMGDAYTLRNEGGPAVSRYEEVIDGAVAAAANNTTKAESNAKIGQLYLRSKQYKLAQEFFEKALAADPEFAPTYRSYADALVGSKAYKKASDIYDKYVQKSGTKDPELLLNVAKYYFLAGDHQKSLDYLDKLKGQVKDPIIDRMTGWSSFALGRNDVAVESLNKFVSTAPQKVIFDDYKYLGRAYAQLGTPEGDSLGIVNLLKAAPSDTTENLYKEVADKYYANKRYDKAAPYMQQAIGMEKKPSNNDYLRLGLAYYQYGLQVPKLIADTAQQQVARKLAFMQADTAFARLAENAEKIGTPYPLAYYYRAQATYFANGREASLVSGAPVPLYEKFIEQALAAQANPETGATTREQNRKYLITAYRYLINNSIAKKDDAKAKEYANKVLELDPNDKDAKEFLNPTPPPAPAKPAAKPATKAAPKKGSAK